MQNLDAVEINVINNIRRGPRSSRTGTEINDFRLAITGSHLQLVSCCGFGYAANVTRINTDAIHIVEDEIALPIVAERGHIAYGMPLARYADGHVEFRACHLPWECTGFQIGFLRIDDEIYHGFADGHDFRHCSSFISRFYGSCTENFIRGSVRCLIDGIAYDG